VSVTLLGKQTILPISSSKESGHHVCGHVCFPKKKREKPARSVSSVTLLGRKNNLPTYPSAHREWVAILSFLFLALHCVCFLKREKHRELWWWFKYSKILLYSSKQVTEWKWISRDTEGERRGSGDDEERLKDSIYHKMMPWIQFVFHTQDFWAPPFSAAAIFSWGSWKTPCTIVAPKWLASNTFEAARTLPQLFLPTCPCFWLKLQNCVILSLLP